MPHDCDSFSSLSHFTLTIVWSFSEALAQSGAFILHPTTSEDANSVSLGACLMIVMAFGRLKSLQLSTSVDALLMSTVMESLQCIAGFHHLNLPVLLVLASYDCDWSYSSLPGYPVALITTGGCVIDAHGFCGFLCLLAHTHAVYAGLHVGACCSYDCDFCIDTHLRITTIVGGSARDGDGSGPSSFSTATISSSAIWWIGACLRL